VKRGHGADGAHDGIVHKNLLASYTHLRSAGNCNWAARFVGFARQGRTRHSRERGNPPILATPSGFPLSRE
jgi:cobyrinic acid a,c-diamide synthase